jgi:hypothetical protein
MSQENSFRVVAGQYVPDATGAALSADRCRASGADGESGRPVKGAPPTNRAPGNYNPETFKPLRFGVDSLYLSYPGVLAEDWNRKLGELKELAQSESETQQAFAQVVIGEHLFEVRDRGRGRFSYVLVDNCYHIQASNPNAKSLPLAYVQISSEYLCAVGVEQAEKSLRFIVSTLGLVKEPANVSRVDLYVDFCADIRMDLFNPLEGWVTRTQSIDLHYRQGRFSGWSFGLGGDVSARLYDKTLEIEMKSKKFYLHELWRAAGWDGEQLVWRMEFQVKRDVLVTLGVLKIKHLLEMQRGLWRYFTEDWLRLATPSSTDSNQTRWPNHPLWIDITAAFQAEVEQPKLSRFSPMRPPQDSHLFINGLAGMTSFMAREGIDDLGEGVGEFLHQAKEFHDARYDVPGFGFERYVEKKVKAKNRRYNSANNRANHPCDTQEVVDAAEVYRKAREGE